jgi:Papain family cysteine protease
MRSFTPLTLTTALFLVTGALLGPGSSSSARAAELQLTTWRAAVPIPAHFIGQPESGYEAEVDLRPQIRARGLHIRNQGNRGTCTVFATTFLIEYQKAGMPGQPPGLALSEEYLNWAANKVNGKPYFDGGFFTKMIPGFNAWAISTAKEMPYHHTYNPSAPYRPNKATIASANEMFPVRYPFVILKVWNDQKGMTAAELQTVLTTLRAGRPVATGIWWLNNFSTVKVHGIPLIKDYPRSANVGSNPPMFDGHSIDLVGFRQASDFPGGGYFIFRNSFGKEWGDHGYGFVSFQFMRTYANDAIAIAPQPWPPVMPPKNAPKY